MAAAVGRELPEPRNPFVTQGATMFSRTIFVSAVVLLAMTSPLRAQDTATVTDRQLRQRLDYALGDTRKSIQELTALLTRMETMRTAVHARITRDSLAARATTGTTTRPTTSTAGPTAPSTSGGPTAPSTGEGTTQPNPASVLVYAHGFEDGTLGTFGQWGGYTPKPVSVVADPTGSGRGKVARVVYERDAASGGPPDVNGGLYARINPAGGHPGGIGFGERIYVAGDVYLPRYQNTAPAQGQFDLRKLLYIKFGDPDRRSGHIVLNAFGRADKSGLDLGLASGLYGSSHYAQDYGLGALAFDRWHRVEVEIVANHRDVADGIVRVWFNGRLVKERTGVLLFSPSPNEASDFIYEYGIGNQEQWQPGDTMKNYRLWDNIEFRTGRP
jgi:hypothetical protein